MVLDHISSDAVGGQSSCAVAVCRQYSSRLTPHWMAPFHDGQIFDGQTDRIFGQTDFWTDGFKKKFLMDCQKEVFSGLSKKRFLRIVLVNFWGNFWAIFGIF